MTLQRINVNQECITNGVPENGKKCPVYLAIKPLVKDNIDISVICYNVSYTETIRNFNDIEIIGNYVIIDNPTDVMKFILQVDEYWTMEPAEFLIDIPEWAMKEGSE